MTQEAPGGAWLARVTFPSLSWRRQLSPCGEQRLSRHITQGSLRQRCHRHPTCFWRNSLSPAMESPVSCSSLLAENHFRKAHGKSCWGYLGGQGREGMGRRFSGLGGIPCRPCSYNYELCDLGQVPHRVKGFTTDGVGLTLCLAQEPCPHAGCYTSEKVRVVLSSLCCFLSFPPG